MKVNDNKILNYIKFFPLVFVISISLIFTLYLFLNYKTQLTNAKHKVQTTLESKYKEKVKKETQKLVDYINLKKSKNEFELKKTLKEKNQTAYQIISSIYKNNKNKPKNKIIELIKEALDEVRFFDGRGYYYLMSMEGYNYFHPIFKKLENTSLLEIQDKKGLYLTKEMIKSVTNTNEAFVKYHWFKPNNQLQQYEKIAHIMKFEPLEVYFVVSDYVDSLHNKWKDDVKLFLNTIEFQDGSHYFIVDKTTKKYIWNINKNFEGLRLSDANYVLNEDFVINGFLDKNKNSFHTYEVKKNDKVVLKTSFTKIIEDWDWIVGIGFYQKDIDKQIKNEQDMIEKDFIENLSNTFVFLLILFFVTISFSKFISLKIEERFKAYNFSINRKIIEMARQEKILAQQSKMAAMGEMIENIAHQWRQPLSVISTSATGLKLGKEFNTLDDKSLIEGLDSINESSQYLSKTIDDFRDFYNNSNKKVDFNINDTIEKSLILLKSRIETFNITIEKSIRKIRYNGFEAELLQIFLNILNNAIDQLKYLNLKKEKLIVIKVVKNKKNIIITIYDNGGGINENILNRIFEPYFTTKDKNLGTGIGLYMVKNMLEKHFDGTIKADNITFEKDTIKQKGASFNITLPL